MSSSIFKIFINGRDDDREWSLSKFVGDSNAGRVVETKNGRHKSTDTSINLRLEAAETLGGSKRNINSVPWAG